MTDTNDNDGFEEALGEDLIDHLQKMSGDLAIAKLSETLDEGLAPMLDQLIKFAAGRRMQMMAYGFTNEDASYMFAAIIERLWPQRDTTTEVLTGLFEHMQDTIEGGDDE